MIRKRIFSKWSLSFYTLLILATTLFTTGSGISAAQASAMTPCPWQQVPSPQATSANTDKLESVSASSASNAWAVGLHYDFSVATSQDQALIEHWNGTAWSIVANPAVSGASAELHAVSAISDDDAWAAGIIGSGTGSLTAFDGGSSLIEQWNGGQWSIVPTPAPAYSTLTTITALSANDIWAAGYAWALTNGKPSSPNVLLMHWDGQAWNLIPTSDPGEISSIKALAQNDVWAVGLGQGSLPLIMHWDGNTWSTPSTASIPGGAFAQFESISGSASNDIWVVGYMFMNPTLSLLLEHWDGSTWTIVTAPTLSATITGQSVSQVIASLALPNSGGGSGGSHSSVTELGAVDILSPTDAWVVGAFSATPPYVFAPFMLHWDGQSWERVAGTNLHSSYNGLAAITHVPNSTQVWGVGFSDNTTAATQSGLIVSSSDSC